MPSVRQKRTKSSPSDASQSNSHTNRPCLKPEDVCVGCIVWLPENLSSSPELRCKKSNEVLEEGGYDHPAVILNIKQRHPSDILGDLTLCIALVTTFEKTSLADYLERRDCRRYRHSIPIISGAENYSLPVLTLENNKIMRKQSYVRLRQIYDIPISALRAYHFTPKARAYNMRLDKPSYDLLMEKLALAPEPYTPSNAVWETAAERLAALAHCGASWDESFNTAAGMADSSGSSQCRTRTVQGSMQTPFQNLMLPPALSEHPAPQKQWHRPLSLRPAHPIHHQLSQSLAPNTPDHHQLSGNHHISQNNSTSTPLLLPPPVTHIAAPRHRRHHRISCLLVIFTFAFLIILSILRLFIYIFQWI